MVPISTTRTSQTMAPFPFIPNPSRQCCHQWRSKFGACLAVYKRAPYSLHRVRLGPHSYGLRELRTLFPRHCLSPTLQVQKNHSSFSIHLNSVFFIFSSAAKHA